MGNNYSNEALKSHVHNQILKHKRSQFRIYLNVREIFKFETPDKVPLSTHHIGVLYVLDSDRSGKYTFEKIYKFVQFCRTQAKNCKNYELHFELQALCAAIFAEDLAKKAKEREIVEW